MRTRFFLYGVIVGAWVAYGLAQGDAASSSPNIPNIALPIIVILTVVFLFMAIVDLEGNK